MKPRLMLITAAVAAVGLTAGCIAGNGAHPAPRSASPSAASSPSGSVAAPATTAVPSDAEPSSAPAPASIPPPGSATCSPGAQLRLTFAQHPLVTHAYQEGLPPEGKHIARLRLFFVAGVTARIKGAASVPRLIAVVRKHWDVKVAGLGKQTPAGLLPVHPLLANPSRGNEALAVYSHVIVYTGRFSTVCAGTRTVGTYVTFGPARLSVFRCGTRPRTPVERRGRQLACN